MPDNVTSDGDVIDTSRVLRWRSERTLLRDQIEHLSQPGIPADVRNLARLAASYVLAGDNETARRYLQQALRTEAPIADQGTDRTR